MQSKIRCWNKLAGCLLLLSSVSCRPSGEPVGEREQLSSPPSDFQLFYDHFHADSAFQMAHITFPLAGMASGNPPHDTIWEADRWVLHKAFDDTSGEYERSFHILTSDLVVETISTRNAPFSMLRRFARLNDGWNLIYYAEMQIMHEQ